MRCLDCGYDLRELAEHRCPECGRAFDPAKPETYAGLPPRDGLMLLGAIFAFLLVAAPIFLYLPFSIIRAPDDPPRPYALLGYTSIVVGGIVSASIAWHYWAILKRVRKPRLCEWKAWAAFILSCGVFSLVASGTFILLYLHQLP